MSQQPAPPNELPIVQSTAQSKSKSPEYMTTTIEPSTTSLLSTVDAPEQLKYSIASHTVRITKHGFAINPIELRYQEIINNLSVSSRRSSDLSFDSNQVGHKILAIIRGFWSQPGFPKGRIVKHDQINSLEQIMNEFNKYPPYPHSETYGNLFTGKMSFAPPSSSTSASKKKSKSKSRSSKRDSTATATSTTTNVLKTNPSDNNIVFRSHRGNFVNLSNENILPQPSPSIRNEQASFGANATTKQSTSKKKTSSGSSSSSSSGGSIESQQPQSFISSFFTSSSSAPSSSSSSTNKQPVHNGKQQAANSKQHAAGKLTKLSAISLIKKSGSPSVYPNFISWIPKDKEEIVDLINSLCSKMLKIFSNEARIVNIPAPCIVLGDIHGNLIDLRTYERSLWPKAPVCCNSNHLFLGDYVDRGDFSVECVLYLFAMKLISPNRFYLLRGNHEVAAIQRQYTFNRECEIKFGQLGRQVWRNFNKVFDVMPVAAIIDKQIFCAHGGIPKSVSNLKQLINEIPSPLDNPEVQCPSAWEILWNDPITDSELIGMIEMDNTVVTQTQITQIQPTSDGMNAITTTVSTKIVPEASSDNNNNADASSSKQSTTSRVNNTSSSSLNQPTTTSTTDHQHQALSEADAILSREPAVALSFYIKPAENQQQNGKSNNGNAKQIGTTIKEVTGSSNESIQTNNNAKVSDDRRDSSSADQHSTSDTLRTVPSDTSSIASTSPQQIINDGFVANIKRGTAYLFSDQAINNFLKLNNLSHVIRAHEVIPTGFAFHGDGRVITIFSSSKYCGLNNQAACALIDRDKIRIFRLDTGDAGE